MFWPYLSYTLGALGHCLQQPHTFLCCYYYFEFNIRKPRLLPGQDAVGSKLLPSLHDRGMNVPTYTEVNKWCCWGSAKSYVQQFLSSKKPRLMSYPSHASTLFVQKGSFWTRNVKWGKRHCNSFLSPYASSHSSWTPTWSSSLLAWEESSAFSGFSWDAYLWAGK